MSPPAPSGRSIMISARPVIFERELETGMARFLGPTNVNRFRKIASPGTSSLERNRILQALAEEWDAFLRECRVTGPTELRTGEHP